MIPKSRASRATQQGFTVLELLTVVVIIALSAAAAAPALNTAMANRRHSEGSRQLLLVARRARAEALAYGRAHLVRFNAANNGSFVVWRGVSSGCNANVWDTVGSVTGITASGACGTAASMCVDQLALSDDDYTLYGDQGIRAIESTGRAAVDLCYEPTGRMLWRIGGGRFSDRNRVGTVNLNGGFRFQFQRYNAGGTAVGVQRDVVLPLSGDARVLR